MSCKKSLFGGYLCFSCQEQEVGFKNRLPRTEQVPPTGSQRQDSRNSNHLTNCAIKSHNRFKSHSSKNLLSNLTYIIILLNSFDIMRQLVKYA